MNSLVTCRSKVWVPVWLRLCAGQVLRRYARCLFVLSTGRCGTATLSRLLDTFPDIVSYHEPPPRFLHETQHAYQEQMMSSRSRLRIARRYAGYRLRRMGGAMLQNKWYVESSNRLTYWAQPLAEGFPRAQFIHLHRHPADVVRSGMRRGYYRGGNWWDPYRITPRRDDPSCRNWDDWTSFEKTCWYWMAVNHHAVKFAEQMPTARVLRISSEELFADSVDVCERIGRFLRVHTPGIETLDEIAREPQNVQTVGEFPKWAEWTQQQRETLRRLTGSLASRLGYDLSEERSHSPGKHNTVEQSRFSGANTDG